MAAPRPAGRHDDDLRPLTSRAAGRRRPPTDGIGRLAGAAAIASAVASAAWLTGLSPAAEFPDRWIEVWNVLLVPAAAWLGFVLLRSSPNGPTRLLAGGSAVAGIAGCVLWATSWERADLEAVWIGLSAAWWIATGFLLVLRGTRWLGWFTAIVGAFAALDALVTWAGDEGIAFLLASPKLPLGWLWALIVGVRLLMDPWLEADRR
jgi:hypothetical protein